jgi:hypothetical protein
MIDHQIINKITQYKNKIIIIFLLIFNINSLIIDFKKRRLIVEILVLIKVDENNNLNK